MGNMRCVCMVQSDAEVHEHVARRYGGEQLERQLRQDAGVALLCGQP